MRRPLWTFCCLLIVLVSFWYIRTVHGWEDAPPDKSELLVIGTVQQKSDTSLLLSMQEITDSENSKAGYVFPINPQYQKLKCEYETMDDPRPEEVLIGQKILVRGEFYSFANATNPGEFDYGSYYRSLGYAGRLKNAKILRKEEKAPGIREYLYRLKSRLETRLYKVFPPKEASVMTALLLGDKSGLDEDVKDLYKRNGIIHILSISGLHITLLGMGIYQRLRKLGVPAQVCAVTCSVALVLYGMMTGFGVSVVRAVGMYLLRMLAQLLGRTYDMMTAWGVLGAGMLIVHPGYVEHMGFLLSYLSILGVGMFLPALTDAKDLKREITVWSLPWFSKEAQKIVKKLTKTLRDGFLAGTSITFTTLPVQLWFSFEVPVYAVILNVLVLPCMSVLVVTGMIAMIVPGLGIVGTISVLILNWYEALCRVAERIPGPVWNPGRPGAWQMAVFYLLWCAVCLCAPAARQIERSRKREKKGAVPERRVRAAQLLYMILAILSLWKIPAGETRITFLDVGQGSGVCAELQSGEVYLFDCGSSSRSRIGERVLIPYLKYRGIHRVDAVFLSHADADHINGILELVGMAKKEHIDIGQIVLPAIDESCREDEFAEIFAAVRPLRVPVAFMGTGDSWRTAGAEFVCLHPSAQAKGRGGNEDSECVCLSVGNCTMLLTGDTEGQGERELLAELAKRDITQIDVLCVAHHGSKNSTSAEFLEQIRPKAAVISCGRHNRYGHPHAETLERLSAAGAQVFRTDEDGAITVYLAGRKVSVSGHRYLFSIRHTVP